MKKLSTTNFKECKSGLSKKKECKSGLERKIEK